MKRLALIAMSVMTLAVVSCKKEIYGCKDSSAENYSKFATTDDGSCYHYVAPVIPAQDANIESSIFTVATWNFNSPVYFKDFTYGELTQDVVNDGAVFIYLQTGSDIYSQLPLTVYPDPSWSTTISFEYGVNYFEVAYIDSDFATTNIGAQTFKIVVIKNVGMMTNNEREIYNM